MRNPATWVVIALLMGFLFVISFQPLIVGNVVYTGDMIDLSAYPYPFIKNNYYNDVYIVLGKNHDAAELFAAQDIAQGLKGYRAFLPPVIIEDQIPETAHNLILVGTPCSNSLVAEFLETDNCNSLESRGIVSIDSKPRKATMIVTGRTPDNVRSAALFLRYYRLYAPTGKVALIDGSISNPNGFIVTYPN